MRTSEAHAVKPAGIHKKLALTSVRGVAGGVLVPALLWGVPAIGTLALASALIDGARYPQTVVALAFAGAFLMTCAYWVSTRERQSDEASLWAASALWLALFAAAAVDTVDLAPGASEGTLVSLVAIAVFSAVWAPYLWTRRTALPHATAWTLAAASALPYGLGILLVLALDVEFSPLLPEAGAVLSALAGIVASAVAARRLPSSARLVVEGTTVCLLGLAWLEVSPNVRIEALGVPVVGALLALVLLRVKRAGWRAVLCVRGPGLIPVWATVGTAFALAPDALILMTFFGGAVALAAWWRLVVRRCGPDTAAQGAAVRCAATRLRSGVTAGAMLATVSLWSFLVSGLAFDRSSGEILASLRAAGVPDINESDISEVILRDEYLWPDQVAARQKPPKYGTPLDRWALPEFDRWSHADWSRSGRRSGRSETVGTGLAFVDDGGTTTVVLAPDGSPAHAVGIRRGDRLLPGKDEPPAKEGSPRRLTVIPADFTVTVTVASRDGNPRTVELTPLQQVRHRQVVRTATIDLDGRLVGYIALQGFDPVAEREFVEAMASFRSKGVRMLVVGLRYNLGGKLHSAAGIAGAILGERGRGEVFASTHHNPRQRDRDRIVRFAPPGDGGLGADQVVVITAAETCSASELLVKGLEPYLPVATVGGTTCGKPVGSLRLDSGRWTYVMISLAVRNAKGEGGYFDGLPPTCVAPDDLAHELGDPDEASLREALHYIGTGQCSAGTGRTVDDVGAVL